MSETGGQLTAGGGGTDKEVENQTDGETRQVENGREKARTPWWEEGRGEEGQIEKTAEQSIIQQEKKAW